MALSFTNYTGDGSTVAYPVTFPFIDASHIYVRVNGIQTSYTFDPISKVVILTNAPASGALIRILRITPRNRAYSEFKRGNAFGQRNVNNSFLWQLYISQEIAEGQLEPTFSLSSDFNMGGYRFTNMEKATVVGNAVEYEQWQAELVIQANKDKIQDERLSGLETGLDQGALRYVGYTFKAVGGESEVTPPYTFKVVGGVYLNGRLLLQPEEYTLQQPTGSVKYPSIVFKGFTLTADDMVFILIGGDQWVSHDFETYLALCEDKARDASDSANSASLSASTASQQASLATNEAAKAKAEADRAEVIVDSLSNLSDFSECIDSVSASYSVAMKGDFSSKGDIMARGTGFIAQPIDNSQSAHYWFRNADGSERGVIWAAQGDSLLNLRSKNGTPVHLSTDGNLKTSGHRWGLADIDGKYQNSTHQYSGGVSSPAVLRANNDWLSTSLVTLVNASTSGYLDSTWSDGLLMNSWSDSTTGRANMLCASRGTEFPSMTLLQSEFEGAGWDFASQMTLQHANAVPSARDFNTMTQAGVYYFGSDAIVVRCQNRPDLGYSQTCNFSGWLEVFRPYKTAAFVMQRYTAYHPQGGTYYRTYYVDLGWSTWKRMNTSNGTYHQLAGASSGTGYHRFNKPANEFQNLTVSYWSHTARKRIIERYKVNDLLQLGIYHSNTLLVSFNNYGIHGGFLQESGFLNGIQIDHASSFNIEGVWGEY